MVDDRFPKFIGALVVFAAALAGPATAQNALETKLQVCGACHGQNGEPINVTTPIIWGQLTNFLVKQLHDYRAGDRDNPVMKGMAQSLTQEELRPAAMYFTAKMWPAKKTAAAAGAMPGGMEVCQVCHQPGFAGGAPAPRLAGQSYEYLIKAMNDFASGARNNNMDMVKIMSMLTADQRDAMARYIAGL
jgi:cytochrome c553